MYLTTGILLLLHIFFSLAKSDKISCKNDAGEDVDWSYMYKLPKNYNKHSKEKSNGLRYLYITDNEANVWKLSEKNIDAIDSMPALTMQPIFNNSNALIIAYNDQFPDGTYKSRGGHTKGMIATDGVTGIWLIHSVPKFSTIPQYEYPKTGAHYGQSFLCLTVKADEMHKIGEQLIFNEPNVYHAFVPESLKGKFSNMETVISGYRRKEPPFSNILNLRTEANTKFTSFAKTSRYDSELYEDLVAPELDVDLFVETWRNGAGNLASNCSRSDKVYNINTIEKSDMQIYFSTHNDHSKWAVTKPGGFKLWRFRVGGGDDWICIGDINRQDDQRKRGGGTVCQKNTKIAKLYRQLINNFDKCQ